MAKAVKQIEVRLTETSMGSSGRRKRRSDETREKIFSAALRLFAERGFNGTTIESITELADVGKGTFFNYFENKEHIMLMFQEKQLKKIQAFVSECLTSEVPLVLLVSELAVSLTNEFGMNSSLFQSFIAAVFTNETVKFRMSDGLSRGRSMLAGVFAERQRRGEIRNDLLAVDIAQGFQQMIFGSMVIWSTSPVTPLEENLKKITEMFLNGIRAN